MRKAFLQTATYTAYHYRFTLPMLVVLAADLGTGHFLWVGGRLFLGGHPKIFELKGGAIAKVEFGRGFLQVNVLI